MDSDTSVSGWVLVDSSLNMRLSCDGDFEEDEVENPVFSTADTVDMEAKLCNSGVHSTGKQSVSRASFESGFEFFTVMLFVPKTSKPGFNFECPQFHRFQPVRKRRNLK